MDSEAIQERFGIIGSSPAIHHVIERVRLVARTDITVLISGESGTGKELVANAIHALSRRQRGNMVIVNCGAIPEGLVESELFGAEKGAYTGSVERRAGYFEQADKGTIFLDEVGEMPLAAQVKLLRVLETGQFTRVGANTTQQVDVRVVAASNRDLAKEVQAGRFREDLYYRLSTTIIHVAPLRDRPTDIIPIFDSYLEKISRKYDAPFKRLEPEAVAVLKQYRWPGNVRELRNVAEQAVVLTRSQVLTADQIRPFLRGVTAGPQGGIVVSSESTGEEARDSRERELIYRLLLEIRLEMKDLRQLIGASSRNAAPDVDRTMGFTGYAAPDIPSVVTPPSRSLPPHRESPDEAITEPVVIEDARYEIEPAQENQKLPTIEEAEKRLILEALTVYEGNRRQTARVLGISERTLYRKLKSLDIEP